MLVLLAGGAGGVYLSVGRVHDRDNAVATGGGPGPTPPPLEVPTPIVIPPGEASLGTNDSLTAALGRAAVERNAINNSLQAIRTARSRKDWKEVARLALALFDAHGSDAGLPAIKIPTPVTSTPPGARAWVQDEKGEIVTPGVLDVAPRQRTTIVIAMAGYTQVSVETEGKGDPIDVPLTKAAAPDDSSDAAGLKALAAGRYPEAEKSFKDALEANAGLDDARLHLAIARYLLHDVAQAEEMLEAYLAKHPTSLDALNALGAVLVRGGRLAEAKRTLEKASAANDKDPTTLYNYALCAERFGNWVLASAEYERVLALDAGHWRALDGLARIHFGAQPAKALGYLDRALESRRDEPRLHFHRAAVLAGLGRDADARAEVESFLSLAPGEDPRIADARKFLGGDRSVILPWGIPDLDIAIDGMLIQGKPLGQTSKAPLPNAKLPDGLRLAGRKVPATDEKAVDLYLWRLPDGSDMEMVRVPGGEFIMGDDNGELGEKPAHRHLMPNKYWIGRTDLTWKQYLAFCTATGRERPEAPRQKITDDHPAVNVSWDDAKAFCEWAGVDLPSEAEWEMAAKGTGGRDYPWGCDWDASMCNSGDSELRRTTPVGNYPSGASPYGVLDMAGNVLQWCGDPWEEKAIDRYARGDHAPPGSSPGRVVRGSAMSSDARGCRSSARHSFVPSTRLDYLGFRVVLRSVAAQGTGERRANFGIRPDYADTEKEAGGVKIAGSRPGSPADKAGVKSGDRMIEFDGKPIKNIEDFTHALRGATTGKPLKVVVLRDGKRLDLEAVLVEIPRKSLLGATVTDGDGNGLLRVDQVTPGGPAAGAGLRGSDMIESIDQRTVLTVKDFEEAMKSHVAGDTVKLHITREFDGSALDITVTLGEHED
jgi:serine/threonine-protein kinase